MAVDSFHRALRWRIAIAFPLTIISACAKYEARPVDLPTMAHARGVATLDEATIEAMRSRIAPGISAAAGNDRLWFLAALLTHDPKIAAARAALATAEAQAKAQHYVTAPTLTLTSEYANDPSTSSPWLIGGAVDLPLDIGGRRGARLRSADLVAMMARYDFAEVVWAERMAARRALIDHFVARQRIALDTELLALRDRQLKSIDERLQSGAISNVEREQARLAHEVASRDLLMAQSQLSQSDATIAALLGVPAASLVDTTWSWQDFDTPVSGLDPVSDADARIAAITARADVLRALAAYDQSDAAYRGEIAKQFPAITISPGYTWERGLVKLPLSVGLALPPLDLNRHAIAAAGKARAEAGKHLEEVVAGAATSIDAATTELRQAMTAWHALMEHDLLMAQAAARRAEDRLRLGDIDRVEWADAQAVLLDARGRALDALARVHLAQAALEDAMRKPLEGPETKMTVSALEAMQ